MTKARSTPSVVLTNADGLAANTGPAFLVLLVTRSEIETCSYTSSLERLMVMADTRENALLYREALILQVTGYDGDRRELPEIPEVRTFFAKLTDAWPHWMWFLSREAGSVSLLMSLICKIKVHRSKGSFGVEFVDPKELNLRLADLLGRGIALFEAFAISPEDAEDSANSAVAVFARN